MSEDHAPTFDELLEYAATPPHWKTIHVDGEWVLLTAAESVSLAEALLAMLGQAQFGPWVERTRYERGERDAATGLDAARRSERGAVLVVRNRWIGGVPGDALESSFTLRLEDGGVARWVTIDTCSTMGLDVTFAAGSIVAEDALAAAFRAAAAVALRGAPPPRA